VKHIKKTAVSGGKTLLFMVEKHSDAASTIMKIESVCLKK
jgi:hypothetical protein